ncbi:MAG TPA: hypothetical protein VJ691_04720 [Vicinamibacterales bacterium]|nr:hypothetical protein [Vicinamibacterales bacterium]
MTRRLFSVGIAAVTLAVAFPTPAFADQPRWTAAERPPILVEHPVLAASLARLHAGSARWRQALDDVVNTGRRVVIVTPDKVRIRDAKGGTDTPFDATVLAEVQPMADEWSRVETVVVVVNLPLFERLYSDASIADLDADLDRILAHEVYGHAIPYLLAGHLSGRCADPVPGQRARDACAIKRENEIRSELRLGKRHEYGLHGLTIARRFRQ